MIAWHGIFIWDDTGHSRLISLCKTSQDTCSKEKSLFSTQHWWTVSYWTTTVVLERELVVLKCPKYECALNHQSEAEDLVCDLSMFRMYVSWTWLPMKRKEKSTIEWINPSNTDCMSQMHVRHRVQQVSKRITNRGKLSREEHNRTEQGEKIGTFAGGAPPRAGAGAWRSDWRPNRPHIFTVAVYLDLLRIKEQGH
jgi:hypothetical protein